MSGHPGAALTHGYVYVILLTSLDSEEDIIAGFDAGADDYITEPFSLHELQGTDPHGRADCGVASAAHRRGHARPTHGPPGIGERSSRASKRRSREPAGSSFLWGILMVDLDHFKQVNDPTRSPGWRCRAVRDRPPPCARVRTTDIVGRYGGEEFVVALPGSDLKQAVAIAEEFRNCIASEPFAIPSGRLSMTTSVGVVTTWDMAEADHLLKTADEALYRAKAGGRNRVVADLRTAHDPLHTFDGRGLGARNFASGCARWTQARHGGADCPGEPADLTDPSRMAIYCALATVTRRHVGRSGRDWACRAQ